MKRLIALLLLCLSFLPLGCARTSYPYLHDMVDYMVGISMDPGRIMINGQLFKWRPSIMAVQWAFGKGVEIDSHTIVYENIGVIAHHNNISSVRVLEFFYSPTEDELPIQKPYRGALHIEGLSIGPQLHRKKLLEYFKDYQHLDNDHELVVYSKNEIALVLPNDIEHATRHAIRDEVEQYLQSNQHFFSSANFFYCNITSIPSYDTFKGDYEIVPDHEQQAIRSIIEDTFQVNTYKLFEKSNVELHFTFDPQTENLIRVKAFIGTDAPRMIQYH